MGATPSPGVHRRHGLMVPVVLIVVGIMFLFDQLVPGWGFSKTWPALLVVMGVIKLVEINRPPRPPEGPRV